MKHLEESYAHPYTVRRTLSVEEEEISRVYIYVVARDFGFAPNPFHGICTLACCMDRLRATAQVGDWIFGMGGSRLKATGRCIYGMKVTKKISFDEYWADPHYVAKRPIRNGSRVMMLGDNIYSRTNEDSPWHQEDSHHSFPDGSPNQSNIDKDTRSNAVLVSEHFVYYGKDAIEVPQEVRDEIGYSNGRGHRVFTEDGATPLLEWFDHTTSGILNMVVADPFDFRLSGARYSSGSNRIIKDEVVSLD